MKLPRSNKNLEKQIQNAVKGLLCPVHRKPATIKMENENDAVQVEACCVFFNQDVMLIGERMRKDFLYKAEKTRERLDKERKRRDSEGM